ncbi:MAG: hypothetical protein DRQ42_01220 [Gammaproteobacteria bacterium]|nr:MAG: hypothetical protein DRQ42_01220 [Gammaproteobacteria bacterium]
MLPLDKERIQQKKQIIASFSRMRESNDSGCLNCPWIPAFARMTENISFAEPFRKKIKEKLPAEAGSVRFTWCA